MPEFLSRDDVIVTLVRDKWLFWGYRAAQPHDNPKKAVIFR
jgi:hypothetical protein